MEVTRKKTKKFRGSMTHGRGKKGGRGAGLRGGRGNAGLHKHRFMHLLKYMPEHLGTHGFKRPQEMIKKDIAINVGQLEERFPGKKTIDLQKEGFTKLLGGGKVTSKIEVTVRTATPKAIDKIEAAQGKITIAE
ncbi:MAG: uL15 family ribosomal protein [Candidatus Thermoplasmatota archaeon]|nr:uL15 family ribosomal protein [Candidatus Thermoplasmatota archaeon]